MKEFLKKLIQSFFIITTGSLFATTIFITFLVPNDTFGVEVLWQVILISLFTTPLSFLFYSSKELSKKGALIRQAIHYLLLNLVLVGCGLTFEWFSLCELEKVLFFLALVFSVYLVVWFACFTENAKDARTLNEKIKAYQKDKLDKSNPS